MVAVRGVTTDPMRISIIAQGIPHLRLMGLMIDIFKINIEIIVPIPISIT